MSDLSKHLSNLSPKKLALLSQRLKKKGEDAPRKPVTVRQKSEFNNCPLSFAQQRLWFLDQLEGGSETYNVPTALTLTGSIHMTALEKAMGEIVQRHEVLRTTFPIVNGTPVQAINPTSTVNLAVVDLQALPEQEQSAQVGRLAIKEQARPFDLSNGPLLRVTLLLLGEKSHVLLVTMHHIISDGWSVSIFIRELTALYKAFSIEEPSPLPELPIQYADFAIWQRQWLQGEVLETQLNYWKQQLAGAPPLLELPTDRPRPPIQTFRGRTERFEINNDLTQRLKALSQKSGTTLFMTLLAAFVTLLGRYSNQEDIVVGSLIANRNRSEIESLIGFFINALVLRTDLKGNPTFSEILTRVQQVTLDAYTHQDVPFEQVVEALQPERNLSYNPLFQVMFVLQNTPVRKLELPGLSITPLELEKVTANYELTLSMEETESGIIGSIEYNIDLFDAATISRMAKHLQTLLAAIVVNQQQHLRELPILTPTERHQLLVEWNQTHSEYPQHQCFHQLFEAQVEKTPDAVAVVFEDEILTYRELNARANRLARLMSEQGVDPQTTVALLAFRSINLITAIIAVFKAGGAYLPLDPHHPPQRLCQILVQSKTAIVLVASNLQAISEKMLLSLPPQSQPQVLLLEELLAQECCQENLAVKVSDNYLAYVIYTSGSTGAPKGAMIEHRGMINHLFAKISDLKLTSNDCVAQTARISFDISVWQFLAALLVGGRVHIFPDQVVMDPAQLLDYLCQGITLLEIVPSLLQMMLLEIEQCGSKRPNLSGLRWLLLTGEALPPQLSRQWFDYYSAIPMLNAYGPTECSDDVTHYPIYQPPDPDVLNIPIGRPVGNLRLYVLDSQLQPVPLGVAGELYVGGIGVGRGYLNSTQQTAEVFLPDPFAQSGGSRLYKTGDLGRYLADGNIEFLGRIDHQLKIRGLRIELGEIEAVLMQHPNVREAIAIAHKDRSGEHRLIAYVVPLLEQLTTSQLQRFLQEQLPDYMVPKTFVQLDALPLTPNGKVDRRALASKAWQPSSDLSGLSRATSFVPPRTPTEEILATVWAEVLGVEVGIHDNFFTLGGHSLLATQVISRLRSAFCVELPLRHLFESPTVAGLSEIIEANLQSLQKAPVIKPVPRQEELPLSFSQERLWFLNQLDRESAAYNISGAIHVTGSLNIAALEQALAAIVKRHEALRTTFPVVNGSPVQMIASTSNLNLTILYLQGLPREELFVEVQRLATEEQVKPFDLVNDSLLRVTLMQLGSESHVLLVIMHHIISDAWSMGIFIKEIALLYEGFLSGQSRALQPLPIQYADFACWQRQWLSEEVLETQLNYWKQQLAGTPPILKLPTDRPRPPVQTFSGRTEQFQIEQDLTQKLKSLSQQSGGTLFMTLITAFAILLGRYSGEEDIVIGSPIANRNYSEIESLIGFFVNTLMLRIDLKENPPFQELLDRVRQVALNAYAHQNLPFEKLVEELQPERSLSHNPLFQVMFVLQNAPMGKLELPGLTLTPLELENITSKFDLTLSINETSLGLQCHWEYNSDLFAAATIHQMAEHFQILLEGIVASPQASVESLPLLTNTELHQLLVEWNNTTTNYSSDKCIHQLFEEQVERTPDCVAAVFHNEQITYRELNSRANQLANYLQFLGVGPEVLVGICVERSLEMVIGLLGILKAGAAYVPLDLDYPLERLSFILEDVQMPVLLIQEQLVKKLPSHWAQVICLDLDWEAIAQEKEENLATEVKANNLAYVMYTSGSTGQPKGVSIVHKGVVRLVKETDYVSHSTKETFLQLAPVCFDASTFEIWGSLLNGAKLVVMPSHKPSLKELGQAIRQHQVTTLWLTASLFHLMVDEQIDDLKSVRQLLAGGDILSVAHVQKVLLELKQCRLINGYGPTENTTFTCCALMTAQIQQVTSVPIGRPIANTQVYILDHHLQPVPIGVWGELYVGGDGLARDYHNRPQLTAEKFIPHLWSKEPGARLYKTGDLACYLLDGSIEFLGRIDNQVKVRGFRIELGEIEAVLSLHPAIKQVVVIDREQTTGSKYLVAYVVPSQETVSTSDLYDFLKQKLPDYMVPAAFVFLDTLPLTPNGKVDRRTLSTLNVSTESLVASFVQPRSFLEKTLAAIWTNVLRLEQVGIYDNFFDLGGHSLLATQVISRVQEAFSVDLSVRQLFEFPTVAQLSEVIEKLIEKDAVLQSPTIMSVSRETRRMRRSSLIKNEIASSAQDKKGYTGLDITSTIPKPSVQ